MNRRETMRNTNRLAREWLFQNGYDFVWLKAHMDGRKKAFKDFYHTRQGVFFATDIYNLFDGICFDNEGTITLLQISTTKFHKLGPYQEFMKNKKGFNILHIVAVKRKHRWEMRTKIMYNILPQVLAN